jgi:hypothetical protein
MKKLLILATLAALPALAQTPSAKSTKRAHPPVAARDTTLGHKFKTKSKPSDGPVSARMLLKK